MRGRRARPPDLGQGARGRGRQECLTKVCPPASPKPRPVSAKDGKPGYRRPRGGPQQRQVRIGPQALGGGGLTHRRPGRYAAAMIPGRGAAGDQGTERSRD